MLVGCNNPSCGHLITSHRNGIGKCNKCNCKKFQFLGFIIHLLHLM